MKVSVVVPVYRNRASLVELHERLTSVGVAREWRLEQIYETEFVYLEHPETGAPVVLARGENHD